MVDFPRAMFDDWRVFVPQQESLRRNSDELWSVRFMFADAGNFLARCAGSVGMLHVMLRWQMAYGGFLKWRYPNSPWVPILNWSNDLDDLQYPYLGKPHIAPEHLMSYEDLPSKVRMSPLKWWCLMVRRSDANTSSMWWSNQLRISMNQPATRQSISTTFSWFAEDVFFSGNPLRLGNRWREFFYMFCLGSWNKSKGMFGHFEYRALHFRATLILESYARAEWT